MLDQLVESKSNAKENTRRSEFMLITLFLAVTVVLFLWTRDLFGKDYGMGADDLSLTTLVAPVPVPEEEPPPEPEKKMEKEPDVDVRKELIQNIMSSPVKPPETISTIRNLTKEMRTDRLTKLGSTDSDTGARVDPGAARTVSDGGTGGLSTSQGTASTGGDEEPPPPPVKKAPPKTVSGGVLNGKATSLPKPGYPAAARAVRASGPVSVQVLISESGGVISANAVSGHPLLRAAAEGAARGARFSPTLLSGQPVKVSGVITYNFVP
jgi:protein TonB